MATLYELTDELIRFLEFSAEENLTADQMKDTLDAMVGNYDVKMDAYGKVIKNLEAGIEARDAEIERLKGLNQTDKNKVDGLKANALYHMDAAGIKKAGTLFKFTAKDSAPKYRVLDESKVPEEFYKVIPATKKLDKKALNNATKADPKKFEGIVEIYRDRQLMMK